MTQPQVIFLDAVGTLFGVRGSVGQVYSDQAAQFGVEAEPEGLQAAFLQSFRAARPAAFPGVAAADLPQAEFRWWQDVSRETFAQAGLLAQFDNFEDYFENLYAYFATAGPWEVYPDVRPALEAWRQQGIPLGIISNFDSRLFQVLAALGLADYFQGVILSTQAGMAKPDPAIFHLALSRFQVAAAQAWHIGDSYREDVEAACAAGLKGIYLDRSSQMTAGAIPSLTALLADSSTA